MMLRDIAAQAGVAAAQAHAYLTSFRKMGLVEQEASAGRYRLGPFALELSMARLRGFDPLRMAGEAIETFASEIRFTVALSVWGTYGPTVIQMKEGVDQLYTETRAGTVYSVSGTATGRVFAAHLPLPLVKSSINAENAEGPKSRRVGKPVPLKFLEVELARIRQRGFATIDPPPIRGVDALSAPVFDHVGQIQFAITVIGPGASMDTSDGSPIVEKLIGLTRRLSSQLGHETHPVFGGAAREARLAKPRAVPRKRRRPNSESPS